MRTQTNAATRAWLFALGVCALSACSQEKSSAPAHDTDAQVATDASVDAAIDAAVAVPFEPEPPRVYVAKLKNVLTGLAPTDAELAAVEANPKALADLIDGWMKLPAYQTKLQTFFELAFQQTQITIADLADQTYPRQAVINPYTRNVLARNAQESFARTMRQLISDGEPFSRATTTQRFMLTPALMELYAFLDVWQVDDAGKVGDRYGLANPGKTISVTAKAPIPIAETLDPNSPSFMHWYDPDVGNAKQDPGCMEDPIVYPARADVLHNLLYGGLVGRNKSQSMKCGPYGGSATAAQLTAADFSTWKLVTIRPPAAGEARTPFYDLPKLRTTTELVLTTPRVGFFSTPAFFANWPTNTSNQMRVTANQTLIVALGAQVDGNDATNPKTTPGLDMAHAGSGACFSCHQTLDPTRSIFAATYSWNYHDQLDPAFAGQKGMFAFQGVEKPVTSMLELGETLAAHPLFATAWAQKLCYYVGSAACDPGDPELQRVVAAFKSSGYAWNTLVRELLASPLITHASPTQSSGRAPEVIAVSRRDHFCAALEQRLQLTDPCGLVASGRQLLTKAIAPQIAAGLPSDGYGRGSVAPVLPNEPTLFYRAGIENICVALAPQVVDAVASAKTPAAGKTWSSSAPETAVKDFVSTLMALGAADPRAAKAHDLLLQHFQDALKQGSSARDALRSTFVVACESPSSLSIGL